MEGSDSLRSVEWRAAFFFLLLVGWLFGRSVGRLVGFRLVGWLVDRSLIGRLLSGLCVDLIGWLIGWSGFQLVGWFVWCRLVIWPVGRSVGHSVGWLVGWLVGAFEAADAAFILS